MAKFRALAEPVIGKERAREAERLLLSFDDQPDLRAIMRTVA